MLKPVIQWAVPLLAVLVVGPLVSWPLRHVYDAAGSADISLFDNTAPALVLGLFALALVLGAALGVVTARFFGPRQGLTTTALVVLWPVWLLGQSREVLADGGSPWLLAVEGLVAAASILALAVVIGSSTKHGQGADVFVDLRAHPAKLATPGGLVGVAVSLVVALAGVWFAARSDAPGQAIFATALGAFAAGIAGRFAAEQLDENAPPIAPFVGVALAAILCPVVGGLLTSGDLAREAAAGTLSPWLRVQPAAWVVGACFGLMPGLATAHKPLDEPVPAKA